MLATTVTEPVPALVVAAAVAAAATVVLAVAIAVLTRPRRPRPGPATPGLGGESPAVVNLLCDGFEVSSLAAPATVVDLAARRWITIEELGPGTTVVRLRRRDGEGDLRPHEARVLGHLRSLAVDGVVPTAALTTGPEAASTRWWREFRREVVAEARAAGLCRPRWTPAWRLVVWVPALAAVASAASAMWAGDEVVIDGAEVPTSVWWWWGVLPAVVGGLWVAGRIARSDRQRDTEAGLERAARWLGTREYLATHGGFDRLPAPAVVLWDRYLAHAVALDLAPVATAQLPLGAESDRHAWSRASGQWRHVRVRYPRMRPAWGKHPLAAAASALLMGIIVVFVARTVTLVSSGSLPLVGLTGTARRIAELSAIAALALGALVLAWNAVTLVRAVADLFDRREVEGIVLRRRSRPAGNDSTIYHLAVDTGEGDEVVAWTVDSSTYHAALQGSRVRARVTPRLGHVRDLEVLERPVGLEGSEPVRD
ncbi:MAG TPA: hypothetical protein VK866_00655, partial [Acidimicrobiales bacterium]|nr:hypothetical protein [Acidimicrobiales bacterium]